MPRRLPDAPNLRCPGCGADRLIPLTFPVYQRESGVEVQLRRPMAKCSGCGERIYANMRYRRAVSEPT
jgi:hypothetical protein